MKFVMILISNHDNRFPRYGRGFKEPPPNFSESPKRPVRIRKEFHGVKSIFEKSFTGLKVFLTK